MILVSFGIHEYWYEISVGIGMIQYQHQGLVICIGIKKSM